MAVPTGAEIPIYKSPAKISRMRARVRLDKPIADADFVDEFSGTALNTDLWNFWQPADTDITVTGGKLILSSTLPTNGFPVVQSQPGRFPLDLSIGWTLEWTMDYPVITGFGVFFRVCDLENAEAIIAVKNNEADGYTIEMPDGTVIEDLGTDHTTEHSYSLVYDPVARTYEVFRDTVSKGSISAVGRQAWYIAIGNGSIQVAKGDWTTIAVSRVDLNLNSYESQDIPDWADSWVDGDGATWAYLPTLAGVSGGSHKRNILDTYVIKLPTAAYISGMGYDPDLYAGYDWVNREVIIESQQSDGMSSTSWKELFCGICDEPQVQMQGGTAVLSITIRESVRRQLQMFHSVRGYSDNASALSGLVMNKTWTEIIEDQCQMAGLLPAEYNVHYDPLTPRSWNVLGRSALDAIVELAETGVMAVYRNAGQDHPGRLEIQEWFWGTDTPEIYFDVDEEIVSLDWAATAFGLAAQAVITVQHSEFGEFSDVYPHAPVPSFGAVTRQNAPIAQEAGDINSTRLLPYLKWRAQNRELRSIIVNLVGQDWLEHDIEVGIHDGGMLGIEGQCWIVDGFDYQWDPTNGLRTSVHLVNQHPEQQIMQSSSDRMIGIIADRLLVPDPVTIPTAIAAPTISLSLTLTPNAVAIPMAVAAPTVSY